MLARLQWHNPQTCLTPTTRWVSEEDLEDIIYDIFPTETPVLSTANYDAGIYDKKARELKQRA
jgi:hypothetical protein